MVTVNVTTDRAKQTQQIAQELATLLQGGEVITLAGDLGAGKTTFTQGLAKGLQINRHVTSPTFTIMKQYAGRLTLHHVDAYRLEHSEEDIGLDDILYDDNGVTVIEWATFIEADLPDERLNITMTYIDETTRKLTFSADNPHYKNILQNMQLLKR